MFTATYFKFIQILRVLIDQSIQLSNRDVRDGGAGCVRDGGARDGVRVGGACDVRDGGSVPSQFAVLDMLFGVAQVVLYDVLFDAVLVALLDVLFGVA